MQKMQQSTSSSVDALQGVHDSVSELVQQVANEPSVGLYFVQQHVHKAVPGLLSVKNKLAEDTQEALLYTENAKDALTAIKTMKECGPPAVNSMISMLTASISLLPSLRHPKRLNKTTPSIHTLSIFLILTSLQAEVDSSGYVTTLFNSAYQRASSMRKSMSGSLIAQEASPKEANFMSTESNPNTAIGQKRTSDANPDKSSSSRSVWSVFESAIQRAGNMVGTGAAVSTQGQEGSSFSKNINDKQVQTGRQSKESIEGEVKLADWFKLPNTSFRKLSKKEATDLTMVDGEHGETEADGEDNCPGLDLENPEVVENYEKLRAEHTAKLEAWLGNSKDP
ncbi:unnamed protein product [Sphagnum jensenii]|uniref:Uncharacterized protein n=1 Tax=Sphagnum jensenii TaxID=128206 RepID=A0ABP0W9P3_9BRYO